MKNKTYMNSIVTKEHLKNNPNHIFVFGDNTLRKGKGGAAILRDEPNSYGFITKKRPSLDGSAYYTPDEYEKVFQVELDKLIKNIEGCPHLTFLISKLGAGLANKYGIYEKIIKKGLTILEKYDNVVFLFDIKE